MAIDERDRYELFQDYIDDLLQVEIEQEDKNSIESQRKIGTLLKSLLVQEEVSESDSEADNTKKPVDYVLTTTTTYDEIDNILKNEPVWKNAAKIDRLTAFEDLMRNLVAQEESAVAKARLRTERLAREAFDKLVRDQLA